MDGSNKIGYLRVLFEINAVYHLLVPVEAAPGSATSLKCGPSIGLAAQSASAGSPYVVATEC